MGVIGRRLGCTAVLASLEKVKRMVCKPDPKLESDRMRARDLERTRRKYAAARGFVDALLHRRHREVEWRLRTT